MAVHGGGDDGGGKPDEGLLHGLPQVGGGGEGEEGEEVGGHGDQEAQQHDRVPATPGGEEIIYFYLFILLYFILFYFILFLT